MDPENKQSQASTQTRNTKNPPQSSDLQVDLHFRVEVESLWGQNLTPNLDPQEHLTPADIWYLLSEGNQY